MVAVRDDLYALAAARGASTVSAVSASSVPAAPPAPPAPAGSPAPVPELRLLGGWRRDLVGNDLLEIVEGRLRIACDPVTGKLKRS